MRPSGQEHQRHQIGAGTLQHHRPLTRRAAHRLPTFTGPQHRVQQHRGLQRVIRAVTQTETPAHQVGFRYPVFGDHFQARVGLEAQPQVVWQKRQQLWRLMILLGSQQRFIAESESGEDAHAARPQPIGGFQCQRARLASPQAQFPDLIVDVAGAADPRIGRNHQRERITGLKLPFTHTEIVRVCGGRSKSAVGVEAPPLQSHRLNRRSRWRHAGGCTTRSSKSVCR